MAESDDMREELRNAITVALTIASVAQRQAVRARERARDDARARLDATQAEAQTTAALERARQTVDVSDQAATEATDQQRFAELNDPGWWDTAGAQDIAAKWTEVQQASDSQDPDLAAAARHAGVTMSEQLRERYDIDPSQVDATVTQQLDAYQQTSAAAGGDGTGDGLLAASDARSAGAASSSPDRRRAMLEADGAPRDAIDSALAVEDAFPHRTDQVHRGQARRASAEHSESRAAQRSIARRRT